MGAATSVNARWCFSLVDVPWSVPTLISYLITIKSQPNRTQTVGTLVRVSAQRKIRRICASKMLVNPSRANTPIVTSKVTH